MSGPEHKEGQQGPKVEIPSLSLDYVRRRISQEQGNEYIRFEKTFSHPSLGKLRARFSLECDAEDGNPEEISVEFFSPDKEDALAAMWFEHRVERGRGASWYLRHRLVLTDARGQGLGALALASAERFIQTLHEVRALRDRVPLTCAISSTRPSVIGFGQKNGYGFASEFDATASDDNRELWQKFLEEREAYRGTEEWEERGTLPSFFLVFPADEKFRGFDLDPQLLDRATHKENMYTQETEEPLRLGYELRDRGTGLRELRVQGRRGVEAPTIRFSLEKRLARISAS